jgi:hypothetical protein
MNQEQKKFNKVIKARIKRAGKLRFAREQKLAVIKKINEIKNENTRRDHGCSNS